MYKYLPASWGPARILTGRRDCNTLAAGANTPPHAAQEEW
jgi:hypothetical protein